MAKFRFKKKDVARDWEILKQAKINFENLLSEEMLKEKMLSM